MRLSLIADGSHTLKKSYGGANEFALACREFSESL